MRIALMQPYFLPYIGYFQLIGAVDEFLIYDGVQFSKGGWVNRNRLLLNGEPHYFSLPLRKDTLGGSIGEVELSEDHIGKAKAKILGQFHASYQRAPHYSGILPIIEEILACPSINLSSFVHHSLQILCQHLGISTPLSLASDLSGVNPNASRQDRVIDICKVKEATEYLNSIGGVSLYTKEAFAGHGISLAFLESALPPYAQAGAEFVPALSIVDVLMWNGIGKTAAMLSDYRLT
jgi:hypothetical protein